MVIVKNVRNDKHGFQDQSGKWYMNNFKVFEVGRGDDVEVKLNDKGFLEDVKIVIKGAVAPKSEFKPQEFHLSPEEVKLRALEFVGARNKEATDISKLFEHADMIVDWVNQNGS